MAPYEIITATRIHLWLNDSYGNRTRVTAVKGRCLNRLTKEPYLLLHTTTIVWKTPPVGLEPTTTRLTAECSTDWAKEDYPENTYWLYTFKTTYNSLWLPIISSFLFLSPIGYALDRLVTVSYMHYCTSTSVLSTSSSSRGLTTFVGISHLEGGFTLRCLQRLSRPGLATLPCSW